MDSGIGNPASSLSPSDGYYSFGVGGFLMYSLIYLLLVALNISS
jgi:hypothetical protein